MSDALDPIEHWQRKSSDHACSITSLLTRTVFHEPVAVPGTDEANPRDTTKMPAANGARAGNVPVTTHKDGRTRMEPVPLATPEDPLQAPVTGAQAEASKAEAHLQAACKSALLRWKPGQRVPHPGSHARKGKLASCLRSQLAWLNQGAACLGLARKLAKHKPQRVPNPQISEQNRKLSGCCGHGAWWAAS